MAAHAQPGLPTAVQGAGSAHSRPDDLVPRYPGLQMSKPSRGDAASRLTGGPAQT